VPVCVTATAEFRWSPRADHQAGRPRAPTRLQIDRAEIGGRGSIARIVFGLVGFPGYHSQPRNWSTGGLETKQTVDSPAGRVTLIAQRSLAEVDDTTGNMTDALLIGVPILVLLVGALAWYLAGRALRPVEEYRPATDDEWREFETHFDKRKVELGNCDRPYGSPCQHEHACIRCQCSASTPGCCQDLTNSKQTSRPAENEPLRRVGWERSKVST